MEKFGKSNLALFQSQVYFIDVMLQLYLGLKVKKKQLSSLQSGLNRMLFSVWPLVSNKVHLLVTKTKNSGFITLLHDGLSSVVKYHV